MQQKISGEVENLKRSKVGSKRKNLFRVKVNSKALRGMRLPRPQIRPKCVACGSYSELKPISLEIQGTILYEFYLESIWCVGHEDLMYEMSILITHILRAWK